MSTVVLALNSGSSSLKFGLYEVDGEDAHQLFEDSGPSEPGDALAGIEQTLTERGLPKPAAIGHRVVHGGPKLRRHCLIDDVVMAELEAAAVFAPLHTPPALAIIRAARAHFPDLPQVACLDTAFHAGLPAVARTLPIPQSFRSDGLERFGFHGLSCESILRQLGPDLPARLVIAHLGNGASVTAVRDGKSVDTSMGLTPTGGVVMGTRTGDLDPGVLIYLMREKKLDAEALEDLVDRRSGLLGISGISNDMRQLHAAAASNPDAALAVRMFCYSVCKEIAAMTAVLGGLDLLVFTGGIGEHDAAVRAEISAGLSWFGPSVRVLPAQEEPQIARHTALLSRRPALYPLVFDPIFQDRIWGGRRLGEWLGAPLPGSGPIGEAWVLSDRPDHPSRVAEGPLQGRTIAELIDMSPVAMLGNLAHRFRRFPLLLKFLDAKRMLSVQVHPADGDTKLLPEGETGKTEAWVVLEAEKGSRIYAGLHHGTTAADLQALAADTVDRHLDSFTPEPGQGVLIEAGVVHAVGDGVLLFEVQENSDVTFRLYDWEHIDPTSGKPRALQVAQALVAIDFTHRPVGPVLPVVPTELGELLFDCRYFRVWRRHAATPITVGTANEPRILVGIDGKGSVEHSGGDFSLKRGTIMLLPAAVGACRLRPTGATTILEIAVP